MLDKFDRTRTQDVGDLSFVNPQGRTIFLKQFATIGRATGPSKFQRADRNAVLLLFGVAQVGFEPPQLGVAVERVLERRGRQRRSLLGDVGDGPARRDLEVAGFGVEQSAQRREQRGLAGSVRADQADPPAGVELQAGAVDQTFGAAGEDELAQEDHGEGV
jgi:hypothetical protein